MKNKNLLNLVGRKSYEQTRKSRNSLDSIVSRFSLVSLICLCMLTVGSGNVWGATITFNVKGAGSGTSYVGTETEYTSGSTKYKLRNWIPNSGQVRGNKSTASQDFYIYNTSAIPGTISGISITGGSYTYSKIYYNTNTSSITSHTTANSMSSASATISNGTGTYFRMNFVNGATSGTQCMTSVTITFCPNPTSLTNGDITANTAQLSWSDSYNTNSYEVYVSTSSTTPAYNATPSATGGSGKSAEVTGLNASTTYNWWVRSKSSSTSKSQWVKGTNFTTSSGSCTEPHHVDVGTQWGWFKGETLSLSATAYSTSGSGSPIDAGDITGYQWYKGGTAEGNKIAGATSATYTKANCTLDDAGDYYCKVSTGATCSTMSSAFGVKIYSLECYTGGTTSYNFTRVGSTQTGTVQIDLAANSSYQFKVRQGSSYYGNKGTITEDENTWEFNGNSDHDGNVTVTTYTAGKFTFTLDYSANGASPILAVTYPARTLYLQLCSDWKAASAKYAIYYWRTATGWSDDFMTATTCDADILYTSIPSWAQNVIFVRFNPSKGSTGNYDDEWNRTGDLALAYNKDYYHTLSKGGDNKYYGTWGTYTVPTYTISYAQGTVPTGGGSISGSKADESKTCGTAFTLPSSAVFTTTGYTQDGWATEDGGSKDYNLGGSYTTNAAQAFYPHWSETLHNVTVAYKCGETTVKSSTTINNVGIATTGSTTSPDITGYTWSTWSAMPSGVTTSTTPLTTRAITINATADSKTITANYTANVYNITYKDKDNATYSGDKTAGVPTGAPTTHTYGTATALVNGTKTGYTFGGWYTDASCTVSAGSSIGATAKTTDFTLYAKWTATSYTLSYDLAGGSVATPNPTSYTIESSAITLNNPTKAGYTFAGWTGTGLASATETVTIAAGSTGNRSYTATWTAKNDTYKTALHTSDAGWTTYASGVTKSGAGYTIPAPSSVAKGATSTCEDTHYHFAGWVADEYKGSPSGHIIDASGTTDATGTTYWAVWEKEGAGGGSLTKLTSTYVPAAGDNLVIVAVDGDDKYALYQQTISTSYVAFWNFSNSAATVGADDKNYVTLVSDGGSGWWLGDATNGYVYNASSNNLTVDASSHTSFSITWNSTGFNIVGNSRWLSCRTDLTGDNDNKYRMGGATSGNASGTALFDLYKYVGVSFEDPKAVCEACVATPSISGVSLMGTAFTTTSVPVQATGASAGENCSLAEYGFYWGTSADPSTNNTSSNNLSTGTFSATLTGPFVIGTTYHYRAYGTNEADNTGYSSDATFTLHNVTFNMHDHGDAKAAQVVPEGGKVTNPGNPSATGYTFDGWWANSTFSGSAWDFSTNTVGSGDVVLHAKWTEKPKYTITLNAGNGTVSADGWTAGVSPTWSKTQTNGDEEITFPAANPGCAGWVFKGWKQGSAADDQGSFTPDKTTGATLTPTSNVTYYAVYRQSTPSGTTYSKITSVGDLATTDYAIIAAFSESGNYYAMKNEKNGTYMQETSFTHADSWTNSDADYIWKVLVFGDKVAFYNADEEKFLTIVNGAWELATDGQFFTYSFNSTTKAWTFSSPSGKQLTYSTQFYVGDSQNKAIYLYKRGEAESGNYFTNPSCSDIAVNGVANPAAGGTVQLTATAAKSGDKVWACYTADEDYNFTNWSISGTSASLSSTSAQFTEITVGSADVTATANFTAKVWRTVTWKANGVTLTGGDLGSASVKVEDGHNITTLPPTPTSCESGDGASDQFIGWVVNSENWGNKINDVSAKHIYKRASQFPTVTGDVTYHAVWAASDNTQNHWEKVTDIDDVEAGFKYAIISFDDAYYVKNTDQSADKPSVYAVTKTSGNINYTSDMEFTASAGAYGGFIFTSVAVSGVKIWGSSTNDGVIVSTTSAKANASDEWFPELNATYGVIMTTSNSKYLCTYGTNDWRNYSSGFNASNRAANLYKYAYGHKNYMTLCCDKAITIASPTKTGSGTVTFTEDSPVPTCLGATTDIHVKITPSNGHKCTALTFTREDGEDIVIDVDPAAVIPFTAATDFVITVEQNANTTLNTSVTFTALHDYYIDNMHFNTTVDKSGGYGTAPTLSDESKGEQCTGLHYKFVGWIPETDMNMTTGVPTTTANMVAGGATGKYATGTNYYAIWAEEVTP